MFHAAGWTFPWAITFAFSAQLTMRNIDYPRIWHRFLNSNASHYCAAPTVQVRVPVPSTCTRTYIHSQIGIVDDPAAQRLSKPIKAIIASASTSDRHTQNDISDQSQVLQNLWAL